MEFLFFTGKTKRLIITVLLALPLLCSAQDSQTDSLINVIGQVEETSELEKYVTLAKQKGQSDPVEGQKLNQALLETADRLKNRGFKNKVLTNLGANLLSQGKYDSTILVLDMWEGSLSDRPVTMEFIERNFHKAVAHYYIGEYQTAVELFLSTVNEPALEKDPKFHGRYLRVLGEVYRAADNLDPALEYLQTALEIAETNLDSVGIAASLNRLGVVYYQKTEHEISEKLLLRSLEVSISANVSSVISSNFNDLGELYFATEEYEKCLNLYEQALEYAQDNDGRINTLNNIARLDWKLGKYNEAIKRAKEALKLAEESNILTHKVDAAKIIADSYQELAHFSEATYYYKEYINFRETLFEEEQRRQILELETQYQTAQKEQEIESLQAREAVQRERNLAFMVGLIVVLLFLIVLLMLFFQIRKNNRKISIQNEKLEELNSTKDKFFSIIAHDLRSPMIALQGVGQKLEYYIKRDKHEKLLEMGGKIDQSIDHLNNLLNNLLNWAASQTEGIPYHPEPTDLKQVVDENIQLFNSLSESKGVQLVNRVQNAFAYVDVNTVSTVIRNVLSNAIKFSPEGEQVVFESHEASEQLIVSIIDKGSGMKPEQLQGLTSGLLKSQVGTRGEKGFGLGLKLCNEFMQLNKGEMKVKSEFNVGTTIELHFPKQAAGRLRKMA